VARDPQLRVSDADRDRAITKLGEHAAAGRLSPDELEERGDRALSAQTNGDIAALFADLPRSSSPARSRGRRRDTGSRAHLIAFVAVNLMFIVIWATSGFGYFWPIWPLMGWGIGLSCHLGFGGPKRRRALPRGG
jgi:Domain of unknown function (DUF1707)/2TM domain